LRPAPLTCGCRTGAAGRKGQADRKAASQTALPRPPGAGRACRHRVPASWAPASWALARAAHLPPGPGRDRPRSFPLSSHR
jgi:hypothetical protein